MTRCSWAEGDPLMLAYHDREWGVPVHDVRLLFEFLVLEGAQAGLSWMTILRKRDAYRQAFREFDPKAVARFNAGTVQRLLQSPAIVRNRRKIESAVKNAQVVVAIAAEIGSFDRYVWSFVGGRTRHNAWRTLSAIPSETAESRQMSKDLLRRGASFVGPTICYAFMQATGLVNDHLVSCFRYRQLLKSDSSTTRA
ncbi:MAG: DNA-3-methyladenine glycosylase I [Chloroflexi bacterium]|nr:MAG: DNA-3-methyladenine glycosylase I [Chloroflexota bacterium]